jgi:imidazole glycerol-phosphate synthase subunit HisH
MIRLNLSERSPVFMITIIDYGMGNLCSVSKALDHLGVPNEVSSDPARIEAAERVILPGVGAFGDAMTELDRRGLTGAIKRYAAGGRPLLGICLGMQVLMETSEESPGVAGLGLVAGTVRRFVTDLKVPHMGWNTVRQERPAPIFRGIPAEEYFYFVHSYYIDPAPNQDPVIAGWTNYAGEFPSVLWRGNLMATQFHPEKSQRWGLAMLRNFAAL